MMKNNIEKHYLSDQRGVGLVELLLAVSIFAIGIITFANMVTFTYKSTIYNVNENEGLNLAREGLEAVRSIRNNNPEDFFENVNAGNYEIELTESKWSLSELNGNPAKINERYERIIEIGDKDEKRKEIVSTVSWKGGEESVSLTEHLTFWQKEIMLLPVTEGLVLQLDASAIEEMSDGDFVSQWDDLSGEDNHISQDDAERRPVYRANVIEGRAGVEFDGDDDYLDTSRFIDSSISEITVFLVGDFAGSTNDGWGYGVIQSSGTVGASAFFNGITGTHGDNGSINISLDGNWSNGEIEIYPSKGDARIQTLSYGNSTFRAFVDGSEELNLNVSSSISASGVFAVGGHNSYTRTVDGHIFEVLVYDTTLSDADRGAVEQYLGEKWGINIEN